jgi:hypothetical protein
MLPPEEADAEATRTTDSVQRGLLDLAVELSSPQIFSGSEFALYLRIKNPFSKPIWIHRVATNLPTTVYWKDEQLRSAQDEDKSVVPHQDGGTAFLSESWKRLAHLQGRLNELEELPSDVGSDQEMTTLQEKVNELHDQILQQRELLFLQQGYDFLSVGADSEARITATRFGKIAFIGGDRTELRMTEVTAGSGADGEESVPLQGALPVGAALQPGNDNVWTITLGTKRNLFFQPAAYKLNLSVLYTMDPPSEEETKTPSRLFSNTIPTTVTIRTSLWSVMAGSVAGGLLGASARMLQQSGTADVPLTLATVSASAILAAILSIAAAIFAARKSETQSFVSVEDFWGGALIGFIIGYSGTVAFENITRISSATSAP